VWSQSTGAGTEVSSYNVQTSITGGAPWQSETSTAATVTGTTIVGLTNGVSYKVQIQAVNSAGGTSSWVIANGTYVPFTVPGAPIIGAPVGDPIHSSVAISWTAPSTDGGAAITGYKVTATASGAPTRTCSVVVGTTGCTVTALTNKSTYTFTVVAINAAGPSLSSASAQLQLVGQAQTVSINNSSALLTSYPADNSDVIVLASAAPSGLPIQYSSTDQTICTVTSSGRLSFLKVGTCAVSVGQDGAGSNYAAAAPILLSFTVNAAIPSIPAVASVTSSASGLVVTWIAPALAGGGQIHYTIAATPTSGSGSNVTCTADSPVLTCTLLGTAGLQLGVPYSITASAHTTAVGNTDSTLAKVATWVTVPSAPTLVSAAAHDSSEVRAIVVSWGASASTGGSTITGYVATATAAGSSTSCSSNVSPYSCTIRGLLTGTPYTVTVMAVNAVGNSASTPSVTTVSLGLSQSISVSTPSSPLTLAFASPQYVPIAASASSGTALVFSTSATPTICTMSPRNVRRHHQYRQLCDL